MLCISQAQFALIVFLSSDYIVHESGNRAIKQCILKAKLPPFCTPFAPFKRHFAIKTSDGGVSRYHLSTRFNTLCCSFYCFLGHITRRHLTSVSIAYICTIEIIYKMQHTTYTVGCIHISILVIGIYLLFSMSCCSTCNSNAINLHNMGT